MAHRRSIGGAVVAACLFFGAACAGPTPYGNARAVGIPPLTTSSILAPVPPYAEAELARLERLGGDPAVVLRRAYIHLESGEASHSLRLDNQVLYSANPPSPAEEALALYLRSAAHTALGEKDSAARDRERALELALDEDLRRRLRAAEPEPIPAAAPTPVPAALTILPRSAWQPRPERRNQINPMGRVYRLTIHHSAMTLDSTSTIDAAGVIQRIQRNHLDREGWADIAYHFMIDPAGRIWQARDTRWQGAHAGGNNNRGNLGICLLGNFVPGRAGQPPTPAQVRTLRAFTAQLCREHGISAPQIYTHREMGATECPGAQLQVVVNRMRREMAALASTASNTPSRRGK